MEGTKRQRSVSFDTVIRTRRALEAILPLEQSFPDELSILKKLFGVDHVEGKLQRLNDIYKYTEGKWRDYVAKLPNGRVNYLLIGEAPPWRSPDEKIQYVLDPESDSRTLMLALTKALLSVSACEQVNAKKALAELATRGFLIVDSIPFAMKYPSPMRARTKYIELVHLTTLTHLQKKLSLSSISWSRDVCVAFSLKQNARAVIKGLDNKLNLGGTIVTLSDELIAVNGSGFPDAEKLRQLYRITL